MENNKPKNIKEKYLFKLINLKKGSLLGFN
jgi:hypothetical protein